MRKPVILVDEMNLMYQLYAVNVQGFYHWIEYYKTIENIIGSPSDAHFFCANVNKSHNRLVHKKRQAFFDGLKRAGIFVHEGFTVLDKHNKCVEKGVDVLLALEILKASLKGVRDIIVVSGDSDLVPAIQEAQNNGSRVHAIICNHMPARELSDVVDSVIPLEDILSIMSQQNQLKWKDKCKPFMFSFNKNHNRKGILV